MKAVVIGSSAGGPKALKKLLTSLGEPNFPIVVAQHNLSSEVENFAKWLASETGRDVVLVRNKSFLEAGKIYFPAPNKDIVFMGKDIVGVVAPSDSIAPSIDRLFKSAARYLGGETLALVLGGLGKDGLEGAREVIKSGGRVVVQADPEFSYLPDTVFKNVERVVKRTLDEIILILKTAR